MLAIWQDFFVFVERDAQVFSCTSARNIRLVKRPIRPCLRLPGHHAKEDAEPAKIYAKPKKPVMKLAFFGL